MVIASTLKISLATVKRMRTSFDLYGTPYAPAELRSVLGRPQAMTAEVVGWLLAYLDNRPTAYLDEMQLVLYDEFGLDVAKSTIFNTLHRANWSRKVAKRRAQQASVDLRAAWRLKSMRWSMNRVVFLDESACNERTRYRRFRWSLKGVAPIDVKETKWHNR